MKTQLLSLLAGAVVLSGCASSTYHLQYHANPKKAILPTEEDISLDEAFTVQKGENIIAHPVGFIKAAILKSTAMFQIAGKDLEVAESRVLQYSYVRTPKNIELPKETEFYCDLIDQSPVKAIAAISTLGLSTLGSKTALNTRTCLLDSNNDGNFDQAILIGNKEKEQYPINIDPVAYEVVHHIPLDQNSLAAIKYVGTGFTGNLIFELGISEYGRKQSFRNNRQVIKPDQLPQSFKQFGAEYTVNSFDEETKEINVVVHKPFPIAEYSFFTTYGY